MDKRIVILLVVFCVGISVGIYVAIRNFRLPSEFHSPLRISDATFNGTHLTFTMELIDNRTIHPYAIEAPQFSFYYAFSKFEMRQGDTTTMTIPISNANPPFQIAFNLVCEEGRFSFTVNIQ